MFIMDKEHNGLFMMILVLFTSQFIASSMELFGQIYVNQTLTTLELMEAKEKT